MNLILTRFSKLFGKQSKRFLMTMLPALLLSLLAVVNVTASVYSQKDKISIQADDVLLRDLLREIENNSEYAFFFNDQFAQLDTKVSFVSNNEKIDNIMTRLLKDTKLDYKMLDNNMIVIVPKEAQQEIVVKGKVLDSNGLPIPGANILEKGTSNGAVTDAEGNFTIKVASSESIIKVSFLGYVDEEIVVGNQTNIDIAMVEDIETLSEVVVVGYGSMQRSNVTGSIVSLKGDDITKAPVPNLVEALRGQIPGVRVSRSGGQPGSDVEFTIRGKRSIGMKEDVNNPENNVNANLPLIVVDGVPYSGKISDINPEDISDLSVLKDAAATSIYGASASNGVILVTTKSGLSGKPTLKLAYSHGITDLVQRPEMFDGNGFAQLKMDALRGNPKNHQPITIEEVLDPIEEANYNANKQVDWHDVCLTKGTIDQLSLTLTGGTDKLHFYLNGDVYKEKGIVLNTDFNRYSFRLNTDYAAYKWLTLGAKVQVSVTESNETGNTLDANNKADFSDFVGNSPWGRTTDSLGNLVPTVNGDQFQYNPLYRYKHSDVGRKGYRTSITPFVEIKIIDGLTYKANGFAEIRHERYHRYLDGEYDAQNIGKYTYRLDNLTANGYLFDNILNYSKTLWDKHNLNLTGVYGFQSNKSENINMNSQAFMENYLGFYDIENVENASLNSDLTEKQSGKAYYVVRLSYSYDNRYSLTAANRWDYSSIFGPDKKMGKFRSIAAAWNISNEKFMENIPVINNLKYRISWGEVGNDRIREFQYIASADPVTYTFNGEVVSGWTTGNSGNAVLQWETSKQFNTGIDFGLLNNRISGAIDYFKTNNVDQLYEKQVPIVFGDKDGLIAANVAETKGWGIEAMVSGKILDGDFKWVLGVNFAKDYNEIVNLGGTQVDEEGNPIDDPANGWFIGQDIDVLYDYKFIGVWQDSAAARAMHPDKAYYRQGDPMIADIDGNDTIDDRDKTFLGSDVTPDWYGGISNTFSYKGFELSVLFETVQGIYKVNGFIGNLNGRDNTVAVNYWTPTNPTNDFPEPNSNGTYDYSSACRTQDASFVALRNVSLTYSLPSKLLTKLPVKGVDIYVRGNNLKYFTKYKFSYSPESDFGKFPITKSWTFGLNVTF